MKESGEAGAIPRPRSRNAAVVLLVVDGHQVFADALMAQLRRVVGTRTVHFTNSLEEARNALDDDGKLVVLHAEPSGDAGLGTVQRLASQDIDVLVLTLRGDDDTATVIEALEAGAQGWASRDMGFEALMEAIDQVAAGHIYLSPPVMTSVVRRLLTSAPPHSASHGFIDSLSQRELEILRCLVAGMSKREIAARLYLSIHTVRSHIQRMMRRSDQHTTLALVALARHVGVPPIDENPVGQPPSRGSASDSARP